MGRFRRNARHRELNTAALLGNFRPRQVYDTFTAWYIMVMPAGTLASHCTCGNAPLLLKTSIQSLSSMPRSLASVSLIHTIRARHATRSASTRLSRCGSVDTPFLVRRQEVERLLRITVSLRPITAFTERVSIGGRYAANFRQSRIHW